MLPTLEYVKQVRRPWWTKRRASLSTRSTIIGGLNNIDKATNVLFLFCRPILSFLSSLFLIKSFVVQQHTLLSFSLPLPSPELDPLSFSEVFYFLEPQGRLFSMIRARCGFQMLLLKRISFQTYELLLIFLDPRTMWRTFFSLQNPIHLRKSSQDCGVECICQLSRAASTFDNEKYAENAERLAASNSFKLSGRLQLLVLKSRRPRRHYSARHLV